MGVSIEREAIKRAYSHPNWEEKVNAMPDKQIAAVYARLKNQGRIK